MIKAGVKHLKRDIEWLSEKTGEEHICDSGEETPVLIEGTKKQERMVTIKEGKCNRCGYDRLRHITDHTTDEITIVCNACSATQIEDPQKGYTMKNAEIKRIETEEENGVFIGIVSGYSAYDLEPKTGKEYISFIGTSTITRIHKSHLNEINDKI
jgi:predicted Zn-ribbon and HTH transcriptional regulator